MSTESGSEPFEKFSTWAVDEMLAQERGEKPYAPVFEDERPKSPVDAEKAMSGSESVDTAAIREQAASPLTLDMAHGYVLSLCEEIDRLQARNKQLTGDRRMYHEAAVHSQHRVDAQQQRIEEALSLLREARLALIPGSPHEHPHIIVERIDTLLEQESTDG